MEPPLGIREGMHGLRTSAVCMTTEVVGNGSGRNFTRSTIENRSFVRVFSYSVFLARSGMETSFLLGVRGIRIPEEMTFGFSYLFYNSAID